ncbi:hypothetical protein ACHQM5_001087 [Ranunculus cassubicifolius]
MESDMDEDMEDMFEDVFYENGGGGEKVDEIDFDYEFDASKYFDFTRDELFYETKQAESWFFTAPNYPPSPFVLKLNLGEDTSKANVNISPKSKVEVETDMNPSTSQLDGDCKGLTFYNHMAQDARHPKVKHAKGSTLMKPTASQLAKQNRREIHASSRLLQRPQASLFQHNQKSSENPVVENQAAKRQKLERGHLPKVGDTKQQTSFIHKTSKKEGTGDGNIKHTKLKITIPRQPDLETAHRAQRIRPKNTTTLREEVKSTTSSFRALPLNRKILEGPSLPLAKKSTPRMPEFHEFHLKTTERATQHSFASSSASLNSNKFAKVEDTTKASSIAESGTVDFTRSNLVETPKQEGSEMSHRFKARPLNKKIFSSKGDIGVFRNTKREVTTPMEFHFSTEKKSQYHPPVDLFDKLSLTSDLQQKPGFQPKLPRSSCLPSKASKENKATAFQQQRVMHVVKENSHRFGGRQFQCGVGGDISEIGSRANTRSLDIR